MNMTSNCDVTKAAHQKQMTTLCHWMNPPMKIFCARYCARKNCAFFKNSVWMQWRRQPKNFGAAKMFDFTGITLFLWKNAFQTQNDYKLRGGAWPLWPLATPMFGWTYFVIQFRYPSVSECDTAWLRNKQALVIGPPVDLHFLKLIQLWCMHGYTEGTKKYIFHCIWTSGERSS